MCPVWVDSHAHLTMFEPEELPAVVRRAHENGVGTILAPATSPGDLGRVLEIVTEYEAVVGAAGVHPHDARLLDDGAKRAIQEALAQDGIVAVGEIGLDYYYDNSPREDQRKALEWQLDLALEVDLPVVLHNRESWDDMITVLRHRAGRLRGVCHSFAEGPEEARTAVELGLFLGVSGMVTFKWADRIRKAVRGVPEDRLLVETDSPYLAPIPYRGRRNEPAYVVATGERLAQERETTAVAVEEKTTAAFSSMFAIPGTI